MRKYALEIIPIAVQGTHFVQAAFAELGGTIENLEILLEAYSDVVHEAFGSDTISDKITVISRAIAEAQIRMEGVDKATQDYVQHILAAGDQKITPTIVEPNVPSGAGEAAQKSFETFKLDEELKTATMASDSQARISIAQEEVDKAAQLFGRGSDEFKRAELEKIRVVQQVATEIRRETNEYARLSEEIIKAANLDFTKNQAAELKATSTAIEQYVSNLHKAAAAISETSEAQKLFNLQLEAQKVMGERSVGLIGPEQELQELTAIHEAEYQEQLAFIQKMQQAQLATIDTGKSGLDQSQITDMEALQAALTAAQKAGEQQRAQIIAQTIAVVAQTNKQIEALNAQHNQVMLQDNMKLTQEWASLYQRATNEINGFLTSVITGHATVQKAWEHLWSSMAATFITNMLKIAEQELVGLALHKAVAAQGVLVDAKKAATGAYAATSDIPVVGPILGPAAAAAAFAAVLAFGTFHQGGIASDETLGLLRDNEMVLPPDISAGMQAMISGKGLGYTMPGNFVDTDRVTSLLNGAAGGTGGTGGAGGPGGEGGDGGDAGDELHSHFHYHAGNVSALDRSGFEDVLGKHSGELSKHVQGLVKRGLINPRKFMK
jgi:hypothetical protein